MSAQLSPGDKSKMRTAQSLIKEQRYAEARTLLTQVDHPKATEWIMRIDAIPKAPTPKPSNVGTWIVILVIVVVVGVFGYAIYSGNAQNQQAAKRYVCTLQYTMYSDAWSNCMADTR